MAGDAKSQHRIGYYYPTGNYVAKDLDQALIWYKKAAGQDLLKAQYAYGRLLAFEREGPKDIAQITKSYNRAVKKHRWLMARGGKMPSENEDTAFRFLLMFLSLILFKALLSLTLFIITQWRLYIDRPRRSNPFG